MVLGEALRAGTPVLVRAGSSAADFVAEQGGGVVYENDDEVPAALKTWKPDFHTARQVYERNLSQRQWLDGLERIYRGLQ
jgi:glycosyltransferase involved in cell wall biosynthesis